MRRFCEPGPATGFEAVTTRNSQGDWGKQSVWLTSERESWAEGKSGLDYPAAEIAAPLNFPAIRGILAVQTNLSDRVFNRVHTGWRREEWANCPLFICGKLHPEIT